MRITHVITLGVDMGGAQFNTFYSLRHLRARHDVSLVVGCDGPLKGVCEDAGIPVRIIPMANRVLAPLSDLLSLIRLVAHFRRTRPDIVHTHCSKAGVLGRVAARLAGVPIVLHTFEVPSFHRGQPRHVYWPLWATERICAPLADQLIAVSASTARAFTDAGVCRPEQVKLVVSGIDFSRFPASPFPERDRIRASLGVGPADLLVVSVGHLHERKRHDVLVDAAAAISRTRQRAYFAIVGMGPMEGELREQIRVRGLEGRVVLTGNREDVPELLASADIFVQTSRLEGLSRSLVEALYSGLAVVATDVGGTREVVQDGETGLLIAPNSVAELASALDRLLGGPVLRDRLARCGRAVATGDWGVKAMERGLDDIYRSLSARKGTHTATAPHSPRVVYVINSLVAGGAEGHVVRVASGLKRRGWDVSIFCLSRRGPLIQRAEVGGTRVVGPASFEPRSSIQMLWAIVPLYRYLRRSQPDLVATYLTASDVLGSLAARLAGVGRVVTSRRYLHGYHGIKLLLYRLGMLLSDRLSDRVVAVSEAVRHQAVVEGTPPDVIETIHNSVQLPEGNGRDERSLPGQPIIGTVGHLHPDKGYATLIDSVPALLARLPDASVVIVGEGRDRTSLEYKAADLGVSNHISFLGERLDVPDLLHQFDIFVFPSLREGMPNALLEAMAVGLPVVASGVGGILEVVSDGENGLLVPPSSPGFLADAVVRLWSDAGLREKLGAAAARSIAENFGDVEQEVTRIEAVYLRVLGRSVGVGQSLRGAKVPDPGVLGADPLDRRPLSERV